MYNMKATTVMSRIVAALTLLSMGATLLTGCGHSADEQAAAQQQAKIRKVVKQVKPADPLAGLNTAITGASGDVPVDVRFELLDRPVPNKPVEVRLVFVPQIDLYGLKAVIKPQSGVQVADDAQVKFDKPKKGELQEYKFSAIPSASGIFLVNVNVTVTRDTGDTPFEFSLPIPVPDADAKVPGAPSQPAASSAAAASK